MVIAPTRAACETIELGVQLTNVETIMNREHGPEIRELARSGRGFGIMAGTGTGKTLAVRPIAQEIVGHELRVGVVNREREATPDTPNWNVVIITTGIARRWLQDGLIDATDVVVVDEIHQTSAELELCLALAKRAGCRFVWLSATVDPTFYAEYLESATVIESSAFDPEKAADVRVSSTQNPLAFLGERFMRHVMKEKRGVAVFVPTRAGTEEIAKSLKERYPRILTEYYHGGEPVAKLRPFLEDDGAPHPFILAMTSAGQSALNIRGLDTVIIEDAQFTTLVQRGRSVLTRLPLGSNEILQMAGRVHGRVEGGEVWILSERDIEFENLRPMVPNFQLAGDPERVALTCANMGVRADELDLPVPLDRIAYRRSVDLLTERGLIANNRLTEYGRRVEVLPVDRPWGELLVNADEHLVPVVTGCASIESLHRMLKPDNDIGQYVVKGSDHLTAYNIYQHVLDEIGMMGSVYGLPRHVFDEDALATWCDERGVLVRSIEDAALAIASIYRSLDLSLPSKLPKLNRSLERDWKTLVARVMPFSLVIDEETSWGEEVRVSKTSVCGNWGPVAGELMYFADKNGRTRGSISGTQLDMDLLWEHAQVVDSRVVYDPTHKRNPLRLIRTREYHGFELDRDDVPVERWDGEMGDKARAALADAVISGKAYHPDQLHNKAVMRELREVWRRSGGTVGAASDDALREAVVQKLAGVNSYGDFMETPVRVDADAIVPRGERERWMSLPGEIELDGEAYPLDYSVEEGQGVVRARIPAKLVYRIEDADVPVLELGRPLQWTVVRGKKDPIVADSIEAARLRLSEGGPNDRPRRKSRDWMAMESIEEAGDSPFDSERPRRRGQRKHGGGGGGRGRRNGSHAGASAEDGREGGPRRGGGRGRGPKPGGRGPGGGAKGRKGGGRRKARQ
ncbi:MAG TPA: helicase-related protein [Longimicrobium sp.]|nr:helicase-related protein [Longimicrobium sp.]